MGRQFLMKHHSFCLLSCSFINSMEDSIGSGGRGDGGYGGSCGGGGLFIIVLTEI